MEHVLPAVKTKARRKKRKPPRPQFWFWLGLTLWICYWMIQDILDVAMRDKDPTWRMIDFSIGILLLYYLYIPQFLREYKRWKKDNEDE